MIIFKKIRYKNFLSSGNQWTEIKLDTHKTTLLFGKNGSGKSTVTDAITFALYGKPFRKINKPQLINNYNRGESVCEIEFSVWGKEYRIIRGQKPTIFEIYENGKLINQDCDFNDYQEFLEKNILKMSYKTFTQIVVVGSATYIPFMQLTTPDRRVVVEDLLNIDIIGKMNNALKTFLGRAYSELETTKRKLAIVKERIALHEEYAKTNVNNLKEVFNSLIKEEESLKAQLSVLESSLTEIIKLKKEKEPLIKKLDSLISKEAEINKNLLLVEKSYEGAVKSYNNIKNESICQKCGQIITEDHKEKMLVEKQKLIDECKEIKEKLNERLNAIRNNIKELEKEKITYQELVTQENSLNKEKEMLIKACKKLEKDKQELTDKINETKIIMEKNINEDKNEYEKYDERCKKLTDELEIYEYVQNLLKDRGIKSRIIAYYLPLINKLINKYLKFMNFNIGFYLDENFEEKIQNAAKDTLSYENFSEGEKLRIDLAILFAWRDLVKMRNKVGHVNLLIMDEILDSSLDSDGISDFIKIVKQIIDDKENNVFLISHKDEQLIDKFHRAIKFEKPDGRFTRITEIVV
ncbi:MAG: AAA family ATPase [Patescibacteria group bacterium]|nr:AAA family ATPase [Patescibacteria group bacterium]